GSRVTTTSTSKRRARPDAQHSWRHGSRGKLVHRHDEFGSQLCCTSRAHLNHHLVGTFGVDSCHEHEDCSQYRGGRAATPLDGCSQGQREDDNPYAQALPCLQADPSWSIKRLLLAPTYIALQVTLLLSRYDSRTRCLEE